MGAVGSNSRSLLAAILVVLGFIARLPSLTTPPLDFHATRQYRSAIIARALYFEKRTDIPAVRRKVAQAAAAAQERLEFPLVEHLAAGMYQLSGCEKLWLPRLASVVFWILGSLCFYVFAKRIFSPSASFITLAVCLFAPFGIRASRSFQPDPLMVALIGASWLALVRHDEHPGAKRLFWAIFTSAAAGFVKPMAFFFILPVGIALAFHRKEFRSLERARWFWVWLVLAALPVSAYFLIEFLGGPMPRQAEGSFLPGLWLTSNYWHGWFLMLTRVIGASLFVLAGIGLWLVRSRQAASILRGLWAGYFVFGLVFNYHIHSHDYYSLPILPVAALSIAGLAQIAFDHFRKPSVSPLRFAALIILFAGVAYGAWSGRPTGPPAVLRNTAASFERLGEALGHSSKIIVLDGDYGFPVFYHGKLAGGAWPLSFDLKKAKLQGRDESVSAADRLARYAGAEFFVATNLIEFNAQPDLVSVLKTRFPQIPFDALNVEGNPSILVYDLRPTRFEFDRTELNFGALSDGSAMTPLQPIHLLGGANVIWRTKSSDQAFFVSPASGKGNDTLAVGIVHPPNSEPLKDASGSIMITRDDAVPVSPIHATLTVLKPGASAPPFGWLDLPPKNIDASFGAIFFAGWAMDDIEVKRVLLLREPIGHEDPEKLVLVAEIPRIAGARPDVEKLHHSLPLAWMAGWGIEIRQDSIPKSDGPVIFHVDIEDAERHRVRLGTRSVAWRK